MTATERQHADSRGRRPAAPGPPTQSLTRKEVSQRYFRRLKHGLQIGFLIAYLVPITLLTIYFDYKFNTNVRESSKLHLAAVAESQRNTVDLFMQKRIVNIFNLFHLRQFNLSPSQEEMDYYLSNLRDGNNAFVDIGFFNPQGIQIGYAGPYPHLRDKDYSGEEWYKQLIDQPQSYIITDLYLGLRRKPHFTIGVKQIIDGQKYIIRTSVDPDKLYTLLETTSQGKHVAGFLINREGIYQAVDPEFGNLLEPAVYVPSEEKVAAVTSINYRGRAILVAYTWLKEVPWCLVMHQPMEVAFKEMHAIRNTMLFGSAILVLIIILIIWLIVRRVVAWAETLEIERSDLKSQLYHAHKLVSVGQLAGGVAHEINNPLAIISSQAGLIRDMLNPSLGLDASPEAIITELDEIDNAVYRAKNITQKILSFVRKTEPTLIPSDVNKLLEDVASGIKEKEFKVSNIELVRNYASDLPKLMIDPDLIRQVFLNLINNAGDAVKEGSTITLSTRREDNLVKITIADTGRGMTPEQLEKIFIPFYTTKEVGKGTGLGLPISINIVEGFGGRIEVRSTSGVGSEFTVILPVPKDTLGPE